MGTSKSPNALKDHFIKQIGRCAGRRAVEHFAEDDAAHAVEFAGLAQLPQHAVDLVGLDAGVFKEKQFAFGGRFPGRAEQRNENAEAAAVEGAARGSGLQCAQAFRSAEGVGLAGER